MWFLKAKAKCSYHSISFFVKSIRTLSTLGSFRSLPQFPWNLAAMKPGVTASGTRLLVECSLRAERVVLLFLSLCSGFPANAPTMSRSQPQSFQTTLSSWRFFIFNWLLDFPNDIPHLWGQLHTAGACLPKTPEGCLPRADWALEVTGFSPGQTWVAQQSPVRVASEAGHLRCPQPAALAMVQWPLYY